MRSAIGALGQTTSGFQALATSLLADCCMHLNRLYTSHRRTGPKSLGREGFFLHREDVPVGGRVRHLDALHAPNEVSLWGSARVTLKMCRTGMPRAARASAIRERWQRHGTAFAL